MLLFLAPVRGGVPCGKSGGVDPLCPLLITVSFLNSLSAEETCCPRSLKAAWGVSREGVPCSSCTGCPQPGSLCTTGQEALRIPRAQLWLLSLGADPVETCSECAPGQTLLSVQAAAVQWHSRLRPSHSTPLEKKKTMSLNIFLGFFITFPTRPEGNLTCIFYN